MINLFHYSLYLSPVHLAPAAEREGGKVRRSHSTSAALEVVTREKKEKGGKKANTESGGFDPFLAFYLLE